jgi:hypothetical protein
MGAAEANAAIGIRTAAAGVRPSVARRVQSREGWRVLRVVLRRERWRVEWERYRVGRLEQSPER